MPLNILRHFGYRNKKGNKIKIIDYAKPKKEVFLTITGTMKVELNGSTITNVIKIYRKYRALQYMLSEIPEPFAFINAVMVQIRSKKGLGGIMIWGNAKRDMLKWRKGEIKGSADIALIEDLIDLLRPESSGNTKESNGPKKHFEDAKEHIDESLEDDDDLPDDKVDENKDQGVGTVTAGNSKAPGFDSMRKAASIKSDSIDYEILTNDPNKGRIKEYERRSVKTGQGRTIDKKTYDKDTLNN